MADRDQALAEFQAFTGNENIEECITILEQHDWNLMEAVQNVLAGNDPDPNPPPRISPELSFSSPAFQEYLPSDIEPMITEGIVGQRFRQMQPIIPSDVTGAGGAAAAASFPAATSTDFQSAFSSFTASAGPSRDSSGPQRLLNFNIEYRERNISLSVLDCEKVGKLKELLSEEVGIPASKQDLCGWLSKNEKKVSDDVKLCDLNLPKENTLYLLTPEVCMPTKSKSSNGEDLFERLSLTFVLKIRYKDKDKSFSLNFPGSKTIQEVKTDMFALIDVPVSKQVWQGWPVNDDDTMTLAGSGITHPCHMLEVSSTPKPREKPAQNPDEEAESDEDMDLDSEDEFEDSHDNFNLEDNFLEAEVTGPRKPEPLMPENAANETEALETFSTEFAARFGDTHPVFYLGTLENALKDSLQCRAKDRKLLAIYLHHDQSILSNVFCSQILCAESIVSFLTNNFTVWAWDLTSDNNQKRLLALCNRHFGNVAASTVKNIKSDELPLLLLISRSRGINEVVNAVRGNITLDEVMSHLIHAHEDFREQLQGEISEENERDERESVKREQDAAYQESLAADRAKAESRRLVDEERLRVEQVEAARQHEEALSKRLEEETKEAQRLSLANQLPDEPPCDCKDPVATIRIRCPDGQTLVRRFLAQHTLQVLLNYITSKGFHTTDFKVLTTFPRKDLTQMDPDASFEALKLYPQETIILEEK